jgi:hypothetical protein
MEKMPPLRAAHLWAEARKGSSAGITGDLTARKISSNGSVSVEGKRQLWHTRCHLWVLRKRMLGSLKPNVHQSFRAPFLFLLAKS